MDGEIEHHPWCNLYFQPRAGCKTCKEFYKKYPVDCSPEELTRKHFPDAVLVQKVLEAEKRVDAGQFKTHEEVFGDTLDDIDEECHG